jgi:hypothetical protein
MGTCVSAPFISFVVPKQHKPCTSSCSTNDRLLFPRYQPLLLSRSKYFISFCNHLQFKLRVCEYACARFMYFSGRQYLSHPLAALRDISLAGCSSLTSLRQSYKSEGRMRMLAGAKAPAVPCTSIRLTNARVSELELWDPSTDPMTKDKHERGYLQDESTRLGSEVATQMRRMESGRKVSRSGPALSSIRPEFPKCRLQHLHPAFLVSGLQRLRT